MCNKKKAYAVFILGTLAVGALSGFLNMGAMEQYQVLNQPPLAPPSWLFPVAWSILYILMGAGAAMVYCEEESAARTEGLRLYGVQLVFNFLWSFFFFTLEWRLFSLGWLLVLLILVIWMTKVFYQVSSKAAFLQIPYILWLMFAAYLNFGVWWLNRA